jgi:hypothetical protein
MRLSLWLVFACLGAASAQPTPQVGVMVGLPVHGPMVTIPSVASCTPGPYYGCDFETIPLHPSFGISASVGFAKRLRSRLDVTYQRVGITDNFNQFVYQTTVASPLGISAGKVSTTGNRWRLPLLLQWDIARYVRVGLGPEASILSSARTVVEIRNTFTGYQRLTGDYYRRLDRTAIFGAAVDIEFPFGVRRLVLAPQIHYTRWTARHSLPGGQWTNSALASRSASGLE